MDMTIIMDGLRRNLVSDYNSVVRELNEYITNELSDSEVEDIHQVLDEKFEQLRQDIGFLLYVYNPEEDKDFTDLSDMIDSLEDFEELGKEDYEDC